MLLLRLRTLYRWIDKHYIGFSSLSFSHEVRENISFTPFEIEVQSFSDRIHWFFYEHPPQFVDPWVRETDIRHQLLHQMELNEKPTSNDLVIWSDLDEIALPSGMKYIREKPPENMYQFVAHFHFYNYRWRSGESWRWAYIQRYGAHDTKGPSWFDLRLPADDRPKIPGISMYHCSYCFRSLGSLISKLKSFSHREFSSGQYILPEYIFSYIYCGYSLFGGNYTFVKFDPLGVDFPDDPRYDYLRKRVALNDLDQFDFDIVKMREYAPCKIPDWVTSKKLPNNMDD
jgi:beta-1,4-mannosyl-glycoprotein beta-1,4-N-acetylglucosaminyltransferase